MKLNLWKTFAAIRAYDRIPKLPRGMLATRYDPAELTRQEREIMARMGIRDQAGVRAAIKKHKVKDAEELLAVLEHQKPQRRVLHRLWQALGRLVGGYERPPHIEDIYRASKRKPNVAIETLKDRIYEARKAYDELHHE